MSWYYAEAGQQAGPVDDAQFDALVASGKVTPETLVWQQGMPNWQPLSQVRPGGTASAAPAAAVTGGDAQLGMSPDDIVCAECGKVFSKSSAIQYGSNWVCAECKPAFLQKVREGAPTGAALPGAIQYAGFWIRFLAKFIDGLIIGVVMIPLYAILFFSAFQNAGRGGGQFGMMPLMLQVIVNLAQVAISIGYNTFFIGKYGATPGKMACKLKVVSPDGGPIAYPRALGRAAAEILSGLICYIGYIMAGFDAEKRALHDHMASTRVIYKQ